MSENTNFLESDSDMIDKLAESGVEENVAAEASHQAAAAPASNALRENIALKGKNAYYYAHARGSKGPEWDGDPTPRLLETTKKAIAEGGELAPLVKKVVKFAWGDEEGKVKIYVDFAANGISFEDTSAVKKDLKFESKSVTLTLIPCNSDDGARQVHYVLDFPALNDKICKATCVVKPSRAILTLTKDPEANFKWYELRKMP